MVFVCVSRLGKERPVRRKERRNRRTDSCKCKADNVCRKSTRYAMQQARARKRRCRAKGMQVSEWYPPTPGCCGDNLRSRKGSIISRPSFTSQGLRTRSFPPRVSAACLSFLSGRAVVMIVVGQATYSVKRCLAWLRAGDSHSPCHLQSSLPHLVTLRQCSPSLKSGCWLLRRVSMSSNGSW